MATSVAATLASDGNVFAGVSFEMRIFETVAASLRCSNNVAGIQDLNEWSSKNLYRQIEGATTDNGVDHDQAARRHTAGEREVTQYLTV